jgi:neuromedin U receptor 1
MNIVNNTLLPAMIADNLTANETLPTVVIDSDELYLVSENDNRDSLYLVIPITLIYAIIFITGCIGNISTCIVIARNKSMYSATNYYLFSLAVSDFILLCSGVPMELYHIWYKNEFAFGDMFCIIRNMINEMAANATVLTSE